METAFDVARREGITVTVGAGKDSSSNSGGNTPSYNIPSNNNFSSEEREKYGKVEGVSGSTNSYIDNNNNPESDKYKKIGEILDGEKESINDGSIDLKNLNQSTVLDPVFSEKNTGASIAGQLRGEDTFNAMTAKSAGDGKLSRVEVIQATGKVGVTNEAALQREVSDVSKAYVDKNSLSTEEEKRMANTIGKSVRMETFGDIDTSKSDLDDKLVEELKNTEIKEEEEKRIEEEDLEKQIELEDEEKRIEEEEERLKAQEALEAIKKEGLSERETASTLTQLL